MMAKYAERTKVPEANSRAEIEKLLDRYGAVGFAFVSDPPRRRIQFRLDDRMIRMDFVMPLDDDAEVRRLWRCIVLCMKSKLEAVASGIVTAEHEFYANIVLPNGRTVAEATGDDVRQAYLTGKQPQLQLMPGGSS